MAIKFFAFFFPTISTFGCFWSQWPTSLAVTSGREGVRTTSFKPWRPHRGSCRGATAIEENNGSRREQWLTSLTVWTVHSICTYMIFIYIYRYRYRYISLSIYLLCEPNDAVRAVAVAKRREYSQESAPNSDPLRWIWVKRGQTQTGWYGVCIYITTKNLINICNIRESRFFAIDSFDPYTDVFDPSPTGTHLAEIMRIHLPCRSCADT